MIILGIEKFKEYEITTEIENLHPYYKFIFHIEDYSPTEEFDFNWLLENHSEIILKKIATNLKIKEILKKELKRNFNKELSRIYIKYFSD